MDPDKGEDRRAIVTLLAKTLIRNGELVALNIDDDDPDQGILIVYRHSEYPFKDVVLPHQMVFLLKELMTIFQAVDAMQSVS